MLKRFFHWLKALFNRAMDNLEDPEIMLDQAKRDMQQALTSNREKAVRAITEKNRLQGLVNETEQQVQQLEAQAIRALQSGNRDLARQFIREKTAKESTLESLKGTLAQAIETVEAVKVGIRRQEEEIRKKLAEALAMKAQWKQAQIQSSITKALEGLTFESEYEGSFAAAREKIKDKQAEAAARSEMMQSSIQGKMMQMEDQIMDTAAEEELKKLEQRLGMGAPSVTTPTPATVANTTSTEIQPDAQSSVEAELSELEKRLNQGQS